MNSTAFVRICLWSVFLVGTGFLILTPPSYYRYSAVGFDMDRLEGDVIIHSYHRLRWPGDGTVRCGMGEKQFSVEEEDVDIVDLAGRLFDEPTLDLHRRAESGFALWRAPEVYDSKEGRHLWARWISVPAWLPGVVLLGIGTVLYLSVGRAARCMKCKQTP